MKRILAIILAMAMMLSLVACKNNADVIPSTPTNSQTDSLGENTNPTTNPSETFDGETDPATDTTTNQATEPTHIENKQELWENVFSEGTFIVHANSFKVTMEGVLTITLLTDENGKAYFSIEGDFKEQDVDGTAKLALYQKDAENIYLQQKITIGTETTDEWSICVIDTNEDKSAIEEMMFETSTTDAIVEALNMIDRVEYVETIDGLDYIDIHYTITDEFGGSESTVVRAAMDPTSYEIKAMIVTEENESATVEFIACDNVDNFVVVPDNIVNQVKAEDATMDMAMTMFAILMSNTDWAEQDSAAGD